MMIGRRMIVAALSLVGSVVAPGTGAVAQQAVGPPDDARYALHRRLTEQGERASRTFRPIVHRAVPNNGIVQTVIPPVPYGTFFKDGPQPVTQPLPASRTPRCPYATTNPYTQAPMRTASLTKSFPDVTWHVCVTDMRMKSLWVGPVHLRRGSGPWMTVLYQAGLAEIFVPYHVTNFRPYDLQWVRELDQVTAQDAGPSGSLIKLTNETVPTVVAEVRDRGIGWLCKDASMAVRRGQELVVWGVADGGNYDNIVQYGFRDDGGMTFRLGNTGYNSPNTPPDPTYPPPTEPHTHNGLWRVDMDLGNASTNTASWLVHSEPNTPQAQDYTEQFGMVPFNMEGAQQWNLPQFTSLLIESATTNAFGHELGYEFTPAQTGASRHYGWKEAWTHNDVYATAYHGNELDWVNENHWKFPDDYLLAYLNGESLTNNDLVVWIKTSAHHHPDDEDKSNADLAFPGRMSGVTLAHWSGFNAEPHNLFNANPLGGPTRCGVPPQPYPVPVPVSTPANPSS